VRKFPQFEFSHVGIFVFDIDKMTRFYQELLGLLETDRGVVHGNTPVVFMSRSARDHHQVVLAGGRTAEPGAKLINQISLRVDSLGDLRSIFQTASERTDVSNLRAVTHGNAYSVYFSDPEGNQLEFFTDAPWYVEQPIIDPLDLSKSDEEILSETYESFKDKPGFKKFSEWQEQLQERIDASEDKQ